MAMLLVLVVAIRVHVGGDKARLSESLPDIAARHVLNAFVSLQVDPQPNTQGPDRILEEFTQRWTAVVPEKKEPRRPF
jgi:hypothetical protein